MAKSALADLASAAGVSPSNFYTYFKTVEEPVLALCEAAATDFQGTGTAHFQADWPGEQGLRQVGRAFILDVMAIWRDHGQVLRVEHMLADNGETAFVESRVRRLRRLHLAIERRVAQAHAGRLAPEGLQPPAGLVPDRLHRRIDRRQLRPAAPRRYARSHSRHGGHHHRQADDRALEPERPVQPGQPDPDGQKDAERAVSASH